LKKKANPVQWVPHRSNTVKAKKTTAKRAAAKKPAPTKQAKRAGHRIIIDKYAGTSADAESVTLLRDVARLYLEHLA
jgi:hypothetical protein